MKTSRKLFLHAPGVHVGGGITLLKALYSAPDMSAHFEQVDIRAAALLPSSSAERHWVQPSFFSRMAAEFRLGRRVSKGDVVLCFHGVAPLFRSRGDVTVFLQNRLLLSADSLRCYSLKTRARLMVERFLIKKLAGRVNKFIVQSPSMAEQARVFLGADATIVVCPFMASAEPAAVTDHEKAFDFVYVASAEPHKNHAALIACWCQLAEQGIRPSLALTLPPESPLAEQIAQLKARWALKVTNLGPLPPEEITCLYRRSGALIYPSSIESLGLPLIEAARVNLPIVASELDYVRDIVEPAETFDPQSPTSIARAVKRHLGMVNTRQPIYAPQVFLREVLQ